MRIPRPYSSIAVPALIVFSASCSTYTPRTEFEPQVELRESFVDEGIAQSDRWWLDYADPGLTEVIESTLADNPSLRIAWARLDQMAAVARAAGAPLYPSAGLAVGAERQKVGDDLVGTPISPYGDTLDSMTAGLTVSYQVDLWRKIHNRRTAALIDGVASRQDLEATALAVSSSAGLLWFGIAAEQATLALLEDQVEIGDDYLDLVQLRFANGLAAAVDVYQQRLQLESTRSQVPAAQTRMETQRHQLAILLGREPRAAVALPAAELPDLPALPATGVPIEVLRSRPDIQAAEMRLAAADHRLAAAIADRYPSLSLSATAGGQAEDFSDILDRWFVNLAANLLAPLFEGGRLEAEVDRNRAVVEERFYAWEASLLAACGEVEDALVTERGLVETERILDRRLELAETTLERARALYVSGLTDYLTVLTSLQSLQSLQRQSIATRLSLLNNRIQLSMALGGSWSRTLERATPAEEEQS